MSFRVSDKHDQTVYLHGVGRIRARVKRVIMNEGAMYGTLFLNGYPPLEVFCRFTERTWYVVPPSQYAAPSDEALARQMAVAPGLC